MRLCVGCTARIIITALLIPGITQSQTLSMSEGEMENECRAGKEKESKRGGDNSRNGAEIRRDREGWTVEI